MLSSRIHRGNEFYLKAERHSQGVTNNRSLRGAVGCPLWDTATLTCKWWWPVWPTGPAFARGLYWMVAGSIFQPKLSYGVSHYPMGLSHHQRSSSLVLLCRQWQTREANSKWHYPPNKPLPQQRCEERWTWPSPVHTPFTIQVSKYHPMSILLAHKRNIRMLSGDNSDHQIYTKQNPFVCTVQKQQWGNWTLRHPVWYKEYPASLLKNGSFLHKQP